GGASLIPSLVSMSTIRPEIAGTPAGVSLALPASAIQGMLPTPAALRARAASISQESAVLSSQHAERAPPASSAAAKPVAEKLAAAAAISGKRAGDGLPQDLSESLHSIQGRSNKLGSHFAALRAAFGVRKDADLNPAVPSLGETGPLGVSSLLGRAASVFTAPISAARHGLKRFSFFGDTRAPLIENAVAPQSRPEAPEPLVLRRSGLRVFISTAKDLAGSFRRGALSLFRKSPSSAPALLQTEEAAEHRPAAEPDADQGQAPKKGRWFSIGKVAVMFVVSLVVAQIGVEALGAAMPALLEKTFGDFTVVAQLAIVASATSIIGRQLGPLAIKRFGLKKTYLGAGAVRLVSLSLLAGLLATGTMTIPMLTIFYAINGFMGGISLTAMESIPPALVGQSASGLAKYRGLKQAATEIIGIAGPIATGAVVASLGFMPALISFPVATFIALGIVFMTLKIPKDFDKMRWDKLEAEAQAKAKAKAPQHGFWSKITRGAKLVWNTPVLRYSFLGYAVVMMLNPFLYGMIGPAYGLRLIAGVPELATGVTGWVTGLYSLGGFLGGLTMMMGQKRMDARKKVLREKHEAENGVISDEAWAEHIKPWEEEVMRKSLMRWMLFATAGLAAFASLVVPLPMLGALVTLPSWLGWIGNMTLPALVFIAFGLAQVTTFLKLFNFFQSRVPSEDDIPDATGFFGSAALLVSTAGLLGLKFLFQNFTGFAPFAYIAWAMIPLALVYLYLRWQLNRHSDPSRQIPS
ncbi:hypothetical protein ACFL2T_04630, partial [Elusimicrobiota bacterium]